MSTTNARSLYAVIGRQLDDVLDEVVDATPGTVDRAGLRRGVIDGYNRLLSHAADVAGHDVVLQLDHDAVLRVRAADRPGVDVDDHVDTQWLDTVAGEVWALMPLTELVAGYRVDVGAPFGGLVLVVSVQDGGTWRRVDEQPYDSDVPPDELGDFEIVAADFDRQPGDRFLVAVVDSEGRPQRQFEVVGR